MVPPLVDVAEVVELAALVVEAVRDLVADDDADAAVVERLREVLVVERGLQDSRGEHFGGNIIFKYVGKVPINFSVVLTFNY